MPIQKKDCEEMKILLTGGGLALHPQPDFGVALKAHEIVEAIYESSRSNSDVSLPLS